MFASGQRVGPSVALAVVLGGWSGAAVALAPEQDARVLLDRWLEDQNSGDFADYQKLYADNFTGVKRSSPRSTTFDRAGWLKDRQRMFGKKMVVEAQNVRIFASPASARIVFTQRWSSGNYDDVGPKHLVLRHGPGGYEIVREEMFTSATGKPGAVDVAAFRQFAFVMDGEVVVSMHPDEQWTAGPAKIDKSSTDRFLLRVRRPVDLKKLPPEIAALAGSPVRLMNSRGVRCEAKLGEFRLRSRVVAGDYDPDGSDEYKDGYPWSGTANFLVAKIDGDREACAGATWARSTSLPVPAIATAQAPSADLKALALKAFGALPESLTIQREFKAWYGHEHRKAAPSWFAFEKRPPSVRVIDVKPGGPTLLSVSASVNEGGCEDGVLGSLWALWQVEGPPGNPRLTLRNQPDPSMTMNPTAAVDVDGDGRVELLFDGFSDYNSANAFGQPQMLEHGIVRVLGDSFVNVEGPETPILICPC